MNGKPDALGSAVHAGFPVAATCASDDFAAPMVANSGLGEHRKSYSKLYDKIRTTRTMNYGAYSYSEWYENGGSNMLPVPGVPRHANCTGLWLRPVQIGEGLRKHYPPGLGDLKVGHGAFALRLTVREMDNLLQAGMSQADFDLTPHLPALLREALRHHACQAARLPARLRLLRPQGLAPGSRRAAGPADSGRCEQGRPPELAGAEHVRGHHHRRQ
ncbi:hypothetical protein GCM10022406_42020 [Hymenobacter algoricola]|uniref:Uncharacterized protein n=1 Tax=Hymenobacter algoricola TaxID=486267 RepID=A0ABP7P0B1_9BACT